MQKSGLHLFYYGKSIFHDDLSSRSRVQVLKANNGHYGPRERSIIGVAIETRRHSGNATLGDRRTLAPTARAGTWRWSARGE